MRRNEASSSNNNKSNRRRETVVADCGTRRSTCGYCKSPGFSSITHGLWAYSITVDDYQELLDRGWRRSGAFLYKPDMERTCCPSYTIRLKASDFVPSKEQRRVWRRMQRFVDGTLDLKKSVEFLEDPSTSNKQDISSLAVKDSLSSNNQEKREEEQILHFLADQIDNAVHTCIESGDFPSGIQLPKAAVKKVSQAKRKLLVEGLENLLFSSNIAFQIGATLRQLQLADKDVLKIKVFSQSAKDDSLYPKIIAEKLASSLNRLKGTSAVSIRACNGHLNFYSAMKPSSFDDDIQVATISEESVATISEESVAGSDGKGRCLKNSEHPQGKRHRLQIRLKRSSFDPQEFDLYRRYQMKVHNDRPDHVSESSYRRFLVDTPLIFVPPSGDGTVPPCGFGSFHQQYLIDDHLVAVGVVDVLPRCLSSKYLFWDPDYAFLSLGKYSALQEIGWVNENQAHCPRLEYYYLGYYIHSCRKMRYKAAYHPSELLCPLRYQWVPYAIARPLLDKRPYVVLSDFASLQNGESTPPSDSESVMGMSCGQEESNDVLMDYDEELETEDESFDAETSNPTVGTEDGDISNILIDVEVSRVRYKDVQGDFDPTVRKSLESRLRKYRKVVGAELSERMVYTIA